MRTAVVTGATGFVGLNLVALLLEQGWRVIALHRRSSDLRYLLRFPVERAVASLEDPSSLRHAIPEGADALFHLAARVAYWAGAHETQYRDNVLGTRNVVEAALTRGVHRLIHTSSVAAYGRGERRVTEDSPSTAAGEAIGYIRTKWLAEQEVREGIRRGLAAVTLNPVNIIGPFDTRNFGRSILMMARGHLPGVPPGSGSFCDVRDVAQALLAAVDRGRIGENYLLGGVDVTYLEYFQTIARVLGRRPPRRTLPRQVLKVVGRAYELASLLTGRDPQLSVELAEVLSDRWSCSSEKAIRELGYQTRSLEQMVLAAVSWLRAERLI